MASLYTRVSQRELSRRPTSRRTMVIALVTIPAAMAAAGAAGIRTVLPGGSNYRPAAVNNAITLLHHTVDSILAMAWVAQPASASASLRDNAARTISTRDRPRARFDAASQATLLEIFDDIRARAAAAFIRAAPVTSDDFVSHASVIDDDVELTNSPDPLAFILRVRMGLYGYADTASMRHDVDVSVHVDAHAETMVFSSLTRGA